MVNRNSKQFKFIDLFAGIGGIRIAFNRVGGKCVFTSEWDEPCQIMYEANFGEKPFGDITKIAAEDVPDHDILAGGFPCQAFSIIGNKLGFADTRGTLFFDVERILKVKQPKAFLLENVKQLATHAEGQTFRVILEHLEKLGYFVHYKVLNGLDFGVPQKRERIMIVGFKKNYPFEFPKRGAETKKLSDILDPEDQIDKKHFLSDYFRKKVQRKLKEQGKKITYRPVVIHENKGGNLGIHPFSTALRANGSYNYVTVNGERRLTPREMLRLQGYPDTFKIIVPDTQARKQAGNSVVIPKIEAVASAMVQAMSQKPQRELVQVNLFNEPKLEYMPVNKNNLAKKALDLLIRKSRVHLYKPIQIAEILYHHRTGRGWNLNDLESYRNISKRWRDDVSLLLVGRRSTSSQKYQDNIFEVNAVPPELLAKLGTINKKSKGAVEAYVYKALEARLSSVREVENYIRKSTPNTFDLKKLVAIFQTTPGLRRSVDKMYEILVYALFATIVRALRAQVTLEIGNKDQEILKDFERFIKMVLGIDRKKTRLVLPAALYRVGVTNAADRGLDIWANFGPAIQVKHLTLTPGQVEDIADSITADKIVIACIDTERKAIETLLKQVGWGERIQGIITISDLDDWYKLCLSKKYRVSLKTKLLQDVSREFEAEFPSSKEILPFMKKRGYDKIVAPSDWRI